MTNSQSTERKQLFYKCRTAREKTQDVFGGFTWVVVSCEYEGDNNFPDIQHCRWERYDSKEEALRVGAIHTRNGRHVDVFKQVAFTCLK